MTQKTCPTCQSKVAVLIMDVANKTFFCHNCASRVCPSFLAHYVLTVSDCQFLRACGIDPEIPAIEGFLKRCGYQSWYRDFTSCQL
jgi:hypothetical protein